jgi:5-methylcytosine-specific restriction endonuclease McrA
MKYIDDNKILELYKQGMLHKEIAQELGYGLSIVTHHLLKMGYGKTFIDKDKVLELHNQGLSDIEIANILNCTRSNITICLNKLGYNNRKSKKDNIALRNRISNSLIGRYTGDKNPNYKGYLDEKEIARGIFKTISKRKIRECNYTCKHCGKRGGTLHTHHIKPFSLILEEFIKNTYSGNIKTFYQEITNYYDFMNEDNLVVLCQDCHDLVHYSDNHELSPYRWESATTIES